MDIYGGLSTAYINGKGTCRVKKWKFIGSYIQKQMFRKLFATIWHPTFLVTDPPQGIIA